VSKRLQKIELGQVWKERSTSREAVVIDVAPRSIGVSFGQRALAFMSVGHFRADFRMIPHTTEMVDT
jgi:hypothetical protein